ncbi:hypothetical protein KIPB_000153 [Kipferlia bialata]|uniref:Uncharacterized protein n=1 Tax=Kipferlia bialata TaxID=797122 RepID=A0A9K3CMZ9_9EUKA|nr:hypothetical protein KIPB_000153 [Kipferlia bialata]|eukprot:g153.t1
MPKQDIDAYMGPSCGKVRLQPCSNFCSIQQTARQFRVVQLSHPVKSVSEGERPSEITGISWAHDNPGAYVVASRADGFEVGKIPTTEEQQESTPTFTLPDDPEIVCIEHHPSIPNCVLVAGGDAEVYSIDTVSGACVGLHKADHPVVELVLSTATESSPLRVCILSGTHVLSLLKVCLKGPVDQEGIVEVYPGMHSRDKTPCTAAVFDPENSDRLLLGFGAHVASFDIRTEPWVALHENTLSEAEATVTGISFFPGSHGQFVTCDSAGNVSLGHVDTAGTLEHVYHSKTPLKYVVALPSHCCCNPAECGGTASLSQSPTLLCSHSMLLTHTDGAVEVYCGRQNKATPIETRASEFRKIWSGPVRLDPSVLSYFAASACVKTTPVKDGHGTGTLPNGARATGTWKSGLLQGQGSCTRLDGSTYVGNYVDSRECGQGTMTYRCGSVYTGEWKDGVRSGRGKTDWGNGCVYEGEWAKNVMWGQGRLTYPTGCIYEGAWKGNKQHGIGRLTFENGDYVVGEWKNGEFSGPVDSGDMSPRIRALDNTTLETIVVDQINLPFGASLGDLSDKHGPMSIEPLHTYVLYMPDMGETRLAQFCESLRSLSLSVLDLSTVKNPSALKREMAKGPQVVVSPHYVIKARPGLKMHKVHMGVWRGMVKRGVTPRVFMCLEEARVREYEQQTRDKYTDLATIVKEHYVDKVAQETQAEIRERGDTLQCIPLNRYFQEVWPSTIGK